MTLLPWGAEGHAFQSQAENAGGQVAEPRPGQCGVDLGVFHCVCQA